MLNINYNKLNFSANSQYNNPNQSSNTKKKSATNILANPIVPITGIAVGTGVGILFESVQPISPKTSKFILNGLKGGLIGATILAGLALVKKLTSSDKNSNS